MDSIAFSFGYNANQQSAGFNTIGADKVASPVRELSQAQRLLDSANTPAPSTELSEEELATVATLKTIDGKVRRHEQAHLSASGGLALSGANFSFKTGPDGQRYAVAGDVSIDVSEGKTAEETLLKARIIQTAALAPSDPSPQDRSVASQAKAMEMQAQVDISRRSSGEQKIAAHYQSNDIPSSVFSTRA